MRRYDPYAQRLTEGIVLAIAGNGPARVSLAERVAGGPTSTDRHDGQQRRHEHPIHPTTHRATDGVSDMTASGACRPLQQKGAMLRPERKRI